jgi:hypothetical protein
MIMNVSFSIYRGYLHRHDSVPGCSIPFSLGRGSSFFAISQFIYVIRSTQLMFLPYLPLARFRPQADLFLYSMFFKQRDCRIQHPALRFRHSLVCAHRRTCEKVPRRFLNPYKEIRATHVLFLPEVCCPNHHFSQTGTKAIIRLS